MSDAGFVAPFSDVIKFDAQFSHGNQDIISTSSLFWQTLAVMFATVYGAFWKFLAVFYVILRSTRTKKRSQWHPPWLGGIR